MIKWCLITLALAIPFSVNAEDAYKVISNVDTSPAVSREALARVYMGRSRTLGGQSVVPLFANNDKASTASFLKDVVGLDPHRYKVFWRRRLYSSRGTPPRSLNLQKVLAQVAERKGIIAVVPLSTPLPATVKVIFPEPPPAPAVVAPTIVTPPVIAPLLHPTTAPGVAPNTVAAPIIVPKP